MLISEHYRNQNRQLHSEKKGYGAKGDKWADKVLELADDLQLSGISVRILDYGCGKGSLSQAINRYPVTNYDPAVDEFAALPTRHPMVVCTDVLEHIEPHYLDDVLRHIHALTGYRLLATIATREAKKRLPDGRNCHLIVQSSDWWEDKLLPYFELHIDQPSQDNELVVIGKPRVRGPS